MKKILLGNNISEISRKLEKYFENCGFCVTSCENERDIIFEQLGNDDYDALVFFVPYAYTKVRDFIQNVNAKFPNLKVYSVFYLNRENEKDKIINNNNKSKYFTTIATFDDICIEIAGDLFGNDSKFSLEIFEFLVKAGFPCYTKSFYLVCLSMQILIKKPKYFTNLSKYLYPLIAMNLNTTLYWVERGIRYMSNSAYKKGIYFNCYPQDCRLKNKLFLQALINEFKAYRKCNNDKK